MFNGDPSELDKLVNDLFDGRSELEDTLRDTLPIRGAMVPTTGINNGVIVKYRTFYLKVYDNPKAGNYDISGYLYNTSEPKFTFHVPYHMLTEFTSQITEDNYFRRPFRVTWLNWRDRDAPYGINPDDIDEPY